VVYAQFNASAPASIMLFGEHAVLYGQSAIACALDQRIHVSLTLRSDRYIHLTSALGTYVTPIDQLAPTAPFQFILTALQHYQEQIQQGFGLEIRSEFSHQVGLGSSAAVTVATLAVMDQWLNQQRSLPELSLLARGIIREVQGSGSGMDALASIYGGVVFYDGASTSIETIITELPLTLIYSGAKTPTPQVVKQVAIAYKRHPRLFAQIFATIEACTQQAVPLLKQQQWSELGQLMDIHQGLQDSLGVNTPILTDIILSLRQHPQIFGAKISGAGLGDCVIGLGKASAQTLAWLNAPRVLIPVVMSTQGVSTK
jgi:mevalonate kinase